MPRAMTLNRSFFLLSTAFLLMCTTAIALGIAFASEGSPTKPYTVGLANLLARNVPRGALFESEGVQFTGFLEPAQGGKPHHIEILLQNCFDSPCEVTLNFDPAGKGAYMRFHSRHTGMPGAAERIMERLTQPVNPPTLSLPIKEESAWRKILPRIPHPHPSGSSVSRAPGLFQGLSPGHSS